MVAPVAAHVVAAVAADRPYCSAAMSGRAGMGGHTIGGHSATQHKPRAGTPPTLGGVVVVLRGGRTLCRPTNQPDPLGCVPPLPPTHTLCRRPGCASWRWAASRSCERRRRRCCRRRCRRRCATACWQASAAAEARRRGCRASGCCHPGRCAWGCPSLCAAPGTPCSAFVGVPSASPPAPPLFPYPAPALPVAARTTARACRRWQRCRSCCGRCSATRHWSRCCWWRGRGMCTG